MFKPFPFIVLVLMVLVSPNGFAQSPASPGVRVERNLVFASPGTNTLRMDLYLPAGHAGNVPVVVLIYGGAWMMRNMWTEVPRARWLARNGYAAAVIDYRLSSEALFPAQIYDCKAAVRWLRASAAQYGLDADHIAAWGDSSGGHLACLLGTAGNVPALEGGLGNTNQSSRVQAVVDFFGPTDFLKMEAEALPGSWINHNSPKAPEALLIGGPIGQNKEKVEEANPIEYVTPDAPPFFIAHGDADLLVPWQQSELLFQALQNARVAVTFYRVAGAGHAGPEFNSVTMRGAVLAFLDKYLKTNQ